MRVFFFNDTATTEIYTLSLHDALPICIEKVTDGAIAGKSLLERKYEQQRQEAILHAQRQALLLHGLSEAQVNRSEEHTSELQSRQYLVCRLLLEKKTRQLLTDLAIFYL